MQNKVMHKIKESKIFELIFKIYKIISKWEKRGAVVAERSRGLLHGTGGPGFESRARNYFRAN